MNLLISSYTTFAGTRRITTGTLATNALEARRLLASDAGAPLLIFDNATGRVVDVDLRGTDDDIQSRLATSAPAAVAEVAPDNAETCAPRGRGRPRLGVVAREVTLLPRHWEWLAGQPGGASVALRKLVEQARLAGSEKDLRRQAHERAYHFMLAIGGDLPQFDEAIRALFAHDAAGLRERMTDWPVDVREHALWLAFGEGH